GGPGLWVGSEKVEASTKEAGRFSGRFHAARKPADRRYCGRGAGAGGVAAVAKLWRRRGGSRAPEAACRQGEPGRDRCGQEEGRPAPRRGQICRGGDRAAARREADREALWAQRSTDGGGADDARRSLWRTEKVRRGRAASEARDHHPRESKEAGQRRDRAGAR